MATTEPAPQQAHDGRDRPGGGRRRPFSTWVKKLTNFKGGSSSGESPSSRHASSSRRHHMGRRRSAKPNNPYPQSGRVGGTTSAAGGGQASDDRYHGGSAASFSTSRSGSATSLERAASSSRRRSSSVEGRAPPTAGARSMAPTVSTDHETTATSHYGGSSLAGTSRTANGGLDSRRGGDSTFSSPAPSVRSLTTTLTTIQSIAPPQNNNGTTNNTNHHPGGSLQFHQPFPTASGSAAMSPASALPAHLAPTSAAAGTGGLAPATGNPTTYSSATANNLLTDNASILTLASSSKRRRRRSLDTDASVRALAPSSLWGGSRESLPLSVLSATAETSTAGGPPTTPGLYQSGSRVAAGSSAAERTSIYSATGVAPALPLPGERNSYYAKQNLRGEDGGSVRSGLMGHGRSDSVNGSIGGPSVTSPLASPREVAETEAEKDKERERDGAAR